MYVLITASNWAKSGNNQIFVLIARRSRAISSVHHGFLIFVNYLNVWTSLRPIPNKNLARSDTFKFIFTSKLFSHIQSSKIFALCRSTPDWSGKNYFLYFIQTSKLLSLTLKIVDSSSRQISKHQICFTIAQIQVIISFYKRSSFNVKRCSH